MIKRNKTKVKTII